jgi:general secretion pathway protein E
MSIDGKAALHSDAPACRPEDLPKVPLVLEGLSTRFIRERRLIPLEMKNGRLKILMADPDDREAVEALAVALSAEVRVYSGEGKMIDDYISRYYGRESQDFGEIIEKIDDPGYEFPGDGAEDVGHLKDLASEAPIIQLVNLLIARALESRASDIHIEPFEEELRIRYRIDGVLHDVETAPKKLQAAIVSRVKIMARLNIAERRLPQDGRIRIKVGEKQIDLRVSTIPVLYGEGIVMRLLDKEGAVIDMERLGFSTAILRRFEDLIRKPHGIILVTGPTGSGKTTTLYGALDRINTPDRKIITVEDPVEYQLRGVNQIQVKPGIGLTFAAALRHIVRQDPDVIMIGEIRDLETAEIAVQSALTGHMVFATLHTNDAPSAVTRLLDLGVEGFLLSSTIRGILAQRLVRVICPDCRERDDSAFTREELALFGLSADTELYRGRGCETCTWTGYYGRQGVFELLAVDDDLRRLVLRNADAGELRRRARESGMKTLLEDGAEKVRRGVTTLQEVFRVTQEV